MSNYSVHKNKDPYAGNNAPVLFNGVDISKSQGMLAPGNLTPAGQLELAKMICEQNGYSGFINVIEHNTMHFRKESRDAILNNYLNTDKTVHYECIFYLRDPEPTIEERVGTLEAQDSHINALEAKLEKMKVQMDGQLVRIGHHSDNFGVVHAQLRGEADGHIKNLVDMCNDNVARLNAAEEQIAKNDLERIDVQFNHNNGVRDRHEEQIKANKAENDAQNAHHQNQERKHEEFEARIASNEATLSRFRAVE